MAKLLVYVLIAVAGGLLTWYRRAESRKRLAEIDAGKRCIGCDGAELECLPGEQVRCLVCGHVASLSSLGASRVSEDELRELTRPSDE